MALGEEKRGGGILSKWDDLKSRKDADDQLLDHFLGAHGGVTYRKAELKTFVSLGVEDKLQEDEVALLGSVLEFSGKTVEDVMTRLEDVYRLSGDKIVDDELVSEIMNKGYSRIPIYDPRSPETYLGYMTIRSLVEYDPTDLHPISTLVERVLPQCPPDLSLLDGYFQMGRSHILLVTTSPGEDQGAVGVVTLEDVVEELIGREIIDESDQYVDVHSRVPVVRRRYRGVGLKKIFEGRQDRPGRVEGKGVEGRLIDDSSV
ncbi:hypothetical protein M231_05151 [Tremella mesenterica]|uniref:CBS domain-containing protein n=1 Tax=Tremella mesenterica TaxID=5217 RepID=A0A4Q1BIU7_TREME|nr:hypothetical protein M231_05151 [Tremella mesenterica]